MSYSIKEHLSAFGSFHGMDDDEVYCYFKIFPLHDSRRYLCCNYYETVVRSHNDLVLDILIESVSE